MSPLKPFRFLILLFVVTCLIFVSFLSVTVIFVSSLQNTNSFYNDTVLLIPEDEEEIDEQIFSEMISFNHLIVLITLLFVGLIVMTGVTVGLCCSAYKAKAHETRLATEAASRPEVEKVDI